MIEVFIISLKNVYKNSAIRTDKLISKIKLFHTNKLKINFVGVNGVVLDNKIINKKYLDQDLCRTKNLGTMGCALSHALVLQLIKIKNLNTDVLVFEEDAVLNKNIFNITDYFPKDYDIIFLHSYHHENFLKQKEDIKHSAFRKIDKQISLDQPIGAIALAINGRNIENIIKNILPIKKAFDWHLVEPCNNLNKYIFNPHFEFLLNPPLQQSYRERIDILYPILKKLF